MKRELPGSEFWALIHPYTGDLGQAEPTERGFTSDLTALVECQKGPFFVKAMRNEGWGRDSIVREKLINSFVQLVSPALRWEVEDEQWIALGFEIVDGRRANFAPGSPDLPVIIELLNRMSELRLPEVARDWTETRWDRYVADQAETEHFRGLALLHTDINPSNLLIGEREAWAVDWSWPGRGAPFIDPAMLVVQLVSSGHSPESAESWAAGCKAWEDAAPEAIDAFAAATTRMYWSFAKWRPEESWLKAVAEAAEAWANHRGVMVGPGLMDQSLQGS
ncbi:protein kinase [Streptomyces xiamenensis]